MAHVTETDLSSVVLAGENPVQGAKEPGRQPGHLHEPVAAHGAGDQGEDHGKAPLVDSAIEVFRLIRQARVDLAYLERFFTEDLADDPEGARAVTLVADTARWVHLHARKLHRSTKAKEHVNQ